MLITTHCNRLILHKTNLSLHEVGHLELSISEALQNLLENGRVCW